MYSQFSLSPADTTLLLHMISFIKIMRMGLVHFPKMSQHTQHKTYSSSSLRVHVQCFFVVLTSPPQTRKTRILPTKRGRFFKIHPADPRPAWQVEVSFNSSKRWKKLLVKHRRLEPTRTVALPVVHGQALAAEKHSKTEAVEVPTGEREKIAGSGEMIWIDTYVTK